jgi:hypothetical protein
MSFDLAFWKRSPTTKTAMINACYDAIIEGTTHPEMAPFDRESVVADIVQLLGSPTDPYNPFGFQLDQGKGPHGDWIIVSVVHSKAHEVNDKLVKIAVKHGIMLYDPQVQGVYNNRRPKKT